MSSTEQRVRAAARELREAVRAAEAEGLRVTWPTYADGLDTIQVSATAKFGQVPQPAPGDEYDAMTKGALIELANARGVEIAHNATKADIIQALKSPPVPAT